MNYARVIKNVTRYAIDYREWVVDENWARAPNTRRGKVLYFHFWRAEPKHLEASASAQTVTTEAATCSPRGPRVSLVTQILSIIIFLSNPRLASPLLICKDRMSDHAVNDAQASTGSHDDESTASSTSAADTPIGFAALRPKTVPTTHIYVQNRLLYRNHLLFFSSQSQPKFYRNKIITSHSSRN